MTPSPSGLVRGVGTARRLRALVALGHPPADLRARSGLAVEVLLWCDELLVTADTHARAVALHDALFTEPGPDPDLRDDLAAAMPSRALGLDEGAVEAALEGRRVRLSIADRAAAVAHLVRAGLNDQQTAERLRITSRTVIRVRQRLGLPPARPCNRRTPTVAKGAA